MPNSTKAPSDLDSSQTLQHAFNDVDNSFTVNGYVAAKVGNRVVRTIIDSVTEDWSFYENQTTLLYTLRLIYDNSAHDNLNSAERTT